MEAVVLAGGFGTRLRSVVQDVPKPMAPIGARPFLEILLRSLARKGFSRVVLSLGYMAEKISDHFGARFEGMALDYVVERAPLGTGGAVRLALTRCVGDHVFVFNGDTFLDLEVAAVERCWQQHGRPIIVARQVADTRRYGRLVAHDGRVLGFTEKGVGGPGLINAGCYVFARAQLDSFETHEAFSLESEYLALAVLRTPFEIFITTAQFVDIGEPEDFRLAQFLLADQP
jgi:D-glycero-alpha-D-manno-heptose 1-phosphate guanylyltransferase